MAGNGVSTGALSRSCFRDVFAPDQPAAHKTRWFIIKLLTHLLADAAANCSGCAFDFLGIEHLFDDRKIVGKRACLWVPVDDDSAAGQPPPPVRRRWLFPARSPCRSKANQAGRVELLAARPQKLFAPTGRSSGARGRFPSPTPRSVHRADAVPREVVFPSRWGTLL